MNHVFNPKEIEGLSNARESFSGLLLTERQFYEVTAITGIIERSMQETGTFQKQLDSYSTSYAASNGISIAKANTVIRDIYAARKGETLKKSLDGLRKNEEKLFDRKNNPAAAELQQAYIAANEVGRMVEQGKKITFNRALAYEASQLAPSLGITDLGAKKLMSESFKQVENREFRDWGKELDSKYYHPQIEAEKAERTLQRSQTRTPQPSM